MSEEKITKIFNVLKQDLNCSIQYFEYNDYQSMRTLANRILENCIFTENCRLFLPGIMLRDISFDYQNLLRNNPSVIENAKEIAIKYLNQLRKDFRIDLDENKLWNDFLNYSLEIRQFQNNPIEANIYKNNLEFTDYIFDNLLNFLRINQSKLSDINNNFFDGIISFMVRVMHKHSINLRSIMIYIYMQLLYGLYQYVVRKNLGNANLFKNDIENEINPFIDYITQDFEKNEINIKTFDDILWKIIRRIRELFIIYKPPQTNFPIG